MLVGSNIEYYLQLLEFLYSENLLSVWKKGDKNGKNLSGIRRQGHEAGSSQRDFLICYYLYGSGIEQIISKQIISINNITFDRANLPIFSVKRKF